MATRTRHNDRTTPTEPAPGSGIAGAEPQTRHSVAPPTNVVLGNAGWATSDLYPTCRTPHDFRCVPSLDRPSLVTPPRHSSPLCVSPPDDWAPQPLALHPQPRRILERADRQWLLWWTPDDVRLGRPRRQRRPALAGGTDASSRDRVSAFRLLRLMARRAVAEYFATLSRLPVGPSRSW